VKNKVVGIRFKTAGKKYYFDPLEFDLNPGDFVVVETVRGIELGEVIEAMKTIDEAELIASLKPVLRKATEKDIEQEKRNNEENTLIMKVCKQLVIKHKLDMKLLGTEYTLDKSKLIIYFTAEGRIDFRDLVKDLANEFRVRIELRQVGARDGAKFLGGIGPCGYLLCCNTFLGEFETVSIKMAKNQNLSLNPTNISGLCGKLLCCIRYEDDTYYEFRQKMPKMMSKVKTVEGIGKVIASNIIDLSVKVLFEDSVIRHYKVDQLLKIFEYDIPSNGDNDNEVVE
jgi:cell fate regulator YaaT (PSP1 superfamily)